MTITPFQNVDKRKKHLFNYCDDIAINANEV